VYNITWTRHENGAGATPTFGRRRRHGGGAQLYWWIKSLTHQTHIPILAPYGYPFLSYVWLNLITLPSPGTVTAHAPCHVTYHRGKGKNDPHFWNPWPQFTYSLCNFQGATTNIKLCYNAKNSVFPLWRLQSSLRMHSITWPAYRGSPKTTLNNFLTPTYLFTIQL